MKELLKVVAKRLFIWSIIINTIYSIADYGESFALSHFCTSPLTLEKIINLTIVIIIIDVIMLVAGKVGSYIDNLNNMKTQTAIQKYYFKNTITGETIISIYPSLEHLKNIINIYEYKRQSN